MSTKPKSGSLKGGKARRKPALLFYYNDPEDGEKKAGISAALGNAVPALSESVGTEENSGEFRFGKNVTKTTVAIYFRTLNARVTEGQDIDPSILTDLSPADWNDLFWFAFRLKDSAFFEVMMKFFPSLHDMIPLVLDSPEPIRLFYFGCYLAECFKLDCRCDRHRVKLLKKESDDWFESLEHDEKVKYQNTPISGAWRTVKKELGHTYDLEEKYKSSWTDDNGARVESGEIFDWYELDRDIQTHLIFQQAKTPKCTCSRSFVEMWNKFCTLDQRIANFLWTNMKRDELMKYAKTDDMKRDGVLARKKSLEEVVSYIEFAK